MGKINSEWHREHRMPVNATKKQRAAWHYEHAQHCGCRALAPSITSLLVSQGYDVQALAGVPGAPSGSA